MKLIESQTISVRVHTTLLSENKPLTTCTSPKAPRPIHLTVVKSSIRILWRFIASTGFSSVQGYPLSDQDIASESKISHLFKNASQIKLTTNIMKLKRHSHEKMPTYFIGPIPQRIINKKYFQNSSAHNYLQNSCLNEWYIAFSNCINNICYICVIHKCYCYGSFSYVVKLRNHTLVYSEVNDWTYVLSQWKQ